MIHRIRSSARRFNERWELFRLRGYTSPEDLPTLALKIARQRRLGTVIGSRCRLIGRIDPLNPHLVQIGDFCVIGGESILLAHGPGFDGSTRSVVEDYVYIGYRVTVLPGVRIGKGSIVGAGAIVTRDVPEGKVVAGNPARILRDVTSEEAADMKHRMHNNLYFGKEAAIS
ncbi:MAG: acyltransferase [Martelella sp.]|uniref:acyltransferase n=1 Tax=Martelella sp. TaxID=1969699 RepID=UPI0032429F2D